MRLPQPSSALGLIQNPSGTLVYLPTSRRLSPDVPNCLPAQPGVGLSAAGRRRITDSYGQSDPLTGP